MASQLLISRKCKKSIFDQNRQKYREKHGHLSPGKSGIG